MNKKRYPLLVFAIISLVVIAVSALFVAIFGINTSIEIGGGSQIEITLSHDDTDGRENAESYAAKVNNVLKQHGASIDTYFVEDKLTETTLVVRVANRDIKNAADLKVEIATALEIDEARVSNVQKLTSYFSNRSVLYVGLAILAVMIICFFMGWLRYGILAGVSLLFAIMHSAILSFALIFATRVQFSLVGLCSVVIISIVSVFAFICILERYKENAKSSQYDELSYDQKLMLSTKQNKWLLVMAVVIFVISAVMILTPVNYVRLAGLNILICLVASGYSTIFMVPALHGYLLELAGAKEKKRLSKNNTKTK